MKLLKEPLLHFLVAGAALFAAYAWLNRGVTEFGMKSSRVVRITAQEVDWLKQTWARLWQRPPSEQELKGIVADYLKEELLAHEARELGLDENDTIVRRRLAQKMEFLVQDLAAAAEPDDNELRRLYEANRERFQVPARISFTQVYFNPDNRDEDAAGRAARALERLSQPGASPDATELGDRSLLDREFFGEDETAVSNLFGAEFARQIFAMAPGQWAGPIASGYGLHLVRVSDKEASQARDFAEVRDKVLEEWHRRHQQAEDEKYFAGLLKKYDVIVEESVKPLLGTLMSAPEGGL